MISFSIFTVPKAFKNEFKIIQINAIKSWISLQPKPDIFLLGNEYGVKNTSKKLKLKHIPSIKKNDFGTPLLNDIFKKINTYNKSEIVIYINTDIILLIDSSLNFLLKKIKDKFKKFMIIGRRYELKVDKLINEKELEKISNINKNQIFLKGCSWIDYFIFTKNLFNENDIPPFAIGRTFWDKWLIGYVLTKNSPVIDATKIIKAYHQSHSFSFKKNWLGNESWVNFKLAKGIKNLYYIDDANFHIDKNLKLRKSRLDFVKLTLNFFLKYIVGNLPLKIQFLLIKIKRILIK